MQRIIEGGKEVSWLGMPVSDAKEMFEEIRKMNGIELPDGEEYVKKKDVEIIIQSKLKDGTKKMRKAMHPEKYSVKR